MMGAAARCTLAVALKDLRIETRGKEVLNSVVPFAATLLIVFGLSFGPDRAALAAAAPALLWLAVLFAGILSVKRSFEIEAEDEALDGLMLAPVDKAPVYLGKAAAVVVQLLFLEALTVLATAALFDVDLLGTPLILAAAFLLGTIGLAAIGTLFAAMTTRARAREALFPLLVLPVVVPVLVAGVRAAQLSVQGPRGEAGPWIALLAAFAVVAISTGTLIFEHLVEE